MSIEEVYQRLKIPLGNGERAFWESQYKSTKDVPGLYKGKHCTGFPNINKALIVDGENSKADLIVPNNDFIEEYGITSFLHINCGSAKHGRLLSDMIETAIKNSKPNDLIMFFNALRNKVSPQNNEVCVIMSISYLHLWVIEKSKMHNKDGDFHENAFVKNGFKIFSDEEFDNIKHGIENIIKKNDNCKFLEDKNELCFAPIHIQISSDNKNEIEQIVNSLLVSSKLIKEIDKNQVTRKFIDNGFRIMIRKDGKWTVNILGGGKLFPITKRS